MFVEAAGVSAITGGDESRLISVGCVEITGIRSRRHLESAARFAVGIRGEGSQMDCGTSGAGQRREFEIERHVRRTGYHFELAFAVLRIHIHFQRSATA